MKAIVNPLITAVLFLSGILNAQVNLSGKVVDGLNSPVEDAIVQLMLNSQFNITLYDTTDALGGFEFYHDNPTSIDRPEAEPRLRGGLLHFPVNGTGQKLVVNIYNLRGRRVKTFSQKNLGRGPQSLNITDLITARGIHFIRVNIGDYTGTFKTAALHSRVGQGDPEKPRILQKKALSGVDTLVVSKAGYLAGIFDAPNLESDVGSLVIYEIDVTPPAGVTGLAANNLSGTEINLNWTSSLSGDANSVMIRYRTDGVFPTDQTNGTLWDEITHGITSATLTGLTGENTYHFSLFVKDTAGNWSSPGVNISIYPLTVHGGTGSGSYTPGANVAITADAAPAGKEFDRWIVNSGNPVIADINAASTRLTMPSTSATVTATYKDLPPVEEQVFKFDIRTDNNGSESSWKLSNQAGDVVASGPPGGTPYGNNQLYSESFTVPYGNYKLEVFDSYGDGLCCSYGDGYFKVFLDDHELIKGKGYTGGVPGFFTTETAYDIRVGPSGRTKTDREEEYLVAHNTRRLRLHAEGGQEYVPLRWSHTLADHAREYANELIAGGICGRTLTVADHANVPHEGENITKSSTLQYYSPDQILNRFVEFEEQPGASTQAHLYVVKWRATQYVGCADAVGNDPNCQIHLCRYATVGNCGGYENWVEDYTFCGTTCSSEGCFTME